MERCVDESKAWMIRAYDDLDPGERAEMEKHLLVCRSCRARFDTFQRVDHLFREGRDASSGKHPLPEELQCDPLPQNVSDHLAGCPDCAELFRLLRGAEEEKDRFGRPPGPATADRAREGAARIRSVFFDPASTPRKRGALYPFSRKPLVTILTAAAATILVVLGLQFTAAPDGLSLFTGVKVGIAEDDSVRSGDAIEGKPRPEWLDGTVRLEREKNFRVFFAMNEDSWVYSYFLNDDRDFETLEPVKRAEANRWFPIPNTVKVYSLTGRPGEREAIVLVAFPEPLDSDSLPQVERILTQQWNRLRGDLFLEHDRPDDEEKAGKRIENGMAKALASRLDCRSISVHVQKFVTMSESY